MIFMVSPPPVTPPAEAVTPTEAVRKPLAHFVLGEKGGIGKTWFSQILIEMYRMRMNKAIAIVDMDISTPNVAKAYQKDIYENWARQSDSIEDDIFALIAQSASKSENESAGKVKGKGKNTESIPGLKDILSEQINLSSYPSKAYLGDKLLDILDLGFDTVISTPSQSQAGLDAWIVRNMLSNNLENPADFILWWLSDGSYESLGLQKMCLDKYPHLRHCLVVNRGIGNPEDWHRFKVATIHPELAQDLHDSKLKAILINHQELSPALAAKRQKESLTWTDILNDPKGDKRFNRRLNGWLSECFNAIESTGYF
jgi:hypothetical protein